MFKQQDKILIETKFCFCIHKPVIVRNCKKKQLINLPNEVIEIQLSIDASYEMMEEKLIKPEERFFFFKKENIENLKLIETEIGNIKKKLQGLEDRSRHDNLCSNGITECENK